MNNNKKRKVVDPPQITNLDQVFSYMYNDPMYGGVGYNKFKDNIRRAGITFTNQQLKHWYDNYHATQVHFPVKRSELEKKMKTIYEPSPGYIQADLMFLDKQASTKHILFTAVDTYSRYAWVVPLHNKLAVSVLPVLEQLYQNLNKNKYHFYTLTSDPGSEFNNDIIKKWLVQHDIKEYQDKPGFHSRSAIVERFNGTLRQRINRMMTLKHTNDYLAILPAVVKGYNNTVHPALGGLTPAQVYKDDKTPTVDYVEKDEHFFDQFNQLKIGDHVRILEAIKGTQSRPGVPQHVKRNYSREIYTVIGIKKYQFIIDTEPNTNHYLWELKKVPLYDKQQYDEYKNNQLNPQKQQEQEALESNYIISRLRREGLLNTGPKDRGVAVPNTYAKVGVLQDDDDDDDD